MGLAVFELNDTGIQVAVDGEIVRTSPGFAVLDGERLLVGEDGMQHARLLPRWTNNRFWNQLNTDALPNATPATRHHADLAFAHLEAMWQPLKDECDQVILLVPAFYNREQLGLLLGMANECGMPVKGVADASLVSAVNHAASDTVLHLDIHLHRITLTQLTRGTLLRRGETESITDTGLFTFWDRWANIVAKQFIQTSRFDPMHEAGTEQLLFNQLPAWIQSLNNQRGGTFELSTGTATHSTAVSAEQLSTAGTQIYPSIVQAIRSRTDAATTLLLSDRLASIPGLKDSLGLVSNLIIVELPHNAAVAGAYANADNIIPNDGGLQHVLSLPATDAAVSGSRDLSTHPSHLLLGHQAVIIGSVYKLSANLDSGLAQDAKDPVCTLYYRSGELLADVTNTLHINGSAATGTVTLNAGDTLTVGDHQVVVIAVT